MKKKYTNSITKFFDDYNDFHHYMFYDESDMEAKELPIKCCGVTVGYVALNNSNKVFCINVDTNLTIRYTESFEKKVSDNFMDQLYDFSKDVKE